MLRFASHGIALNLAECLIETLDSNYDNGLGFVLSFSLSQIAERLMGAMNSTLNSGIYAFVHFECTEKLIEFMDSDYDNLRSSSIVRLTMQMAYIHSIKSGLHTLKITYIC